MKVLQLIYGKEMNVTFILVFSSESDSGRMHLSAFFHNFIRLKACSQTTEQTQFDWILCCHANKIFVFPTHLRCNIRLPGHITNTCIWHLWALGWAAQLMIITVLYIYQAVCCCRCKAFLVLVRGRENASRLNQMRISKSNVCPFLSDQRRLNWWDCGLM